MLGGPQSRSGRSGEEKILDPNGIRTPTLRWFFEFFVNNPLDVKKNMGMLLASLFTSLAFFGVGGYGHGTELLVRSSPNPCIIISRVSVALFRDFHKI
jgi:hypothetical protein